MMTHHIYWLPYIAQPSLQVITHEDIYCSYPSADEDLFYQIHSKVQPGYDTTTLKGLVIELHVNMYKTETDSDARKDDNPYYPTRYNEIKKISKEVFDRLQSNFDTQESRRWYKKPAGYITDCVVAMQVLRNRIVKISDKERNLTLTLEDSVDGGIALFRIDTEERDEFVDSIYKDIYRQVKFHFHEDHYHIPGAIGCAPCRDNVNIHEKDNDGLLHYIRFFHDSLTRELHTLYRDYRDLVSRQHLVKRLLKKRELKRKKLSFYRNCHNLIGQWVYVQTLLGAKENNICRPHSSGEDNKYAAIAHNIDNVRQGTEALLNKIKHFHDEENLKFANRVNNLNTLLAILSIVLALLSFDTVRTFLSALFGIS